MHCIQQQIIQREFYIEWMLLCKRLAIEVVFVLCIVLHFVIAHRRRWRRNRIFKLTLCRHTPLTQAICANLYLVQCCCVCETRVNSCTFQHYVFFEWPKKCAVEKKKNVVTTYAHWTTLLHYKYVRTCCMYVFYT